MPNIRLLILSALFTAMAVAGGLALVQIPNVEVITATIFLAGYLLGPMRGVAIGMCAEFLYSLFNPYGAAAPPIMIAQVAGMALAGGAGGWSRRLFRSRRPPVWWFGLNGLALTAFFDLVTTLGFTLIVGQNFKVLLAALTFGAWFYVLHMTTNALIFSVLLPILVPRLQSLAVFRNLSSANPFANREPIACRAVALHFDREPDRASSNRRGESSR